MQMIDLSIIGPAFIAGLLVLVTHVPLGRKVLKRGIIFLDLAIAQSAAFGVVVAGLMFEEENLLLIQISAGTSAIISAVLLNWTERYWAQYQEAIIGSLFVLMATGSIIALAGNPHGGENLKELLVGQILWITWDQLWPTIIISSLVLGAIVFFKHSLLNFYLPFAVAVTMSVQLVGVYLVFTSLIIPALATLRLSNKTWIAKALLIGAGGYGLGLIFSSVFDLPSGAMIVWSLVVVAIVSNLFSIIDTLKQGNAIQRP